MEVTFALVEPGLDAAPADGAVPHGDVAVEVAARTGCPSRSGRRCGVRHRGVAGHPHRDRRGAALGRSRAGLARAGARRGRRRGCSGWVSVLVGGGRAVGVAPVGRCRGAVERERRRHRVAGGPRAVEAEVDRCRRTRRRRCSSRSSRSPPCRLCVTVAFHAWVTPWPGAKLQPRVQPVTASPRLVTVTSAPKPPAHSLVTGSRPARRGGGLGGGDAEPARRDGRGPLPPGPRDVIGEPSWLLLP